MTTRSTWAVGLALVVSAVGAACTPAPSTSEPAAPSSTMQDRYGAPPVTDPRNLAPRATDPCGTLLTPEVLDRLDYASPGQPDESILGTPVCIYRDDDSRRSAQISVYPERDLLVDTYRERIFPIFVPIVIEGLPATHEQAFPDDITCTTVVGVSDNQAISVDTTVESQPTGPPLIDPCEDGARVAEAVVSTLPPA